MMDISLAADASLTADAIISGSNALPSYMPYDPHTLDNLVPDMFNTAMVAGLGLMGAYVTRVRTGAVAIIAIICAPPH